MSKEAKLTFSAGLALLTYSVIRFVVANNLAMEVVRRGLEGTVKVHPELWVVGMMAGAFLVGTALAINKGSEPK